MMASAAMEMWMRGCAMRVEMRCGCGAGCVMDDADAYYTKAGAFRWMREHVCSVRSGTLFPRASAPATPAPDANGLVGGWTKGVMECDAAGGKGAAPAKE